MMTVTVSHYIHHELIKLYLILTLQVRSEQRSMFVEVPEREDQMTTARVKKESLGSVH